MNVNYTPIFLIYYQNNVGIEDRFTYQTIPVDRAGTAYVGDFTEQLTAEVPLFSSNNEVLPFTITAYYNSPYHGRYFTQNDAFGMHTANYTTMNVGSGWKLSVQETVMKTTVETDNVSTDYYVYTDADGTEHYFEEKSPAPYEDEEGLGYSLSVSGTTYTLSDEKGNKKEFINGYLTRNTTDGNHLATTNDINNITSTYAYDGLGRLTSRTTPSEAGNLKVNQTYVDGSLNRINSNYISGILSLANTYDQGALVAASRKTFEGSTPQWQRYNTPVDAWNNITSVQVQGGNNVDAGENVTWYNPITLASFTFEPNGGPVTQMVYGNGDTEAYSYDLYGQLSSVHYSSNLLDYVEAFGYDAYGNVARSVITDSAGNASADYQYEYDSLGRLIRSQQSGDDITSLWTQHEYDSQNRLSDQYWGVSDSTLHESFTYNSNNGTLSSMLLGTGRTLSFEYDNLLRVSRRNVSGVYQHRRNYMGTGTANRQANQIQYFVYASADGADTKLNYRYDYDAGGNISEIYRSVGSDTLAFYSSYEYDTLSRLVKATDSRGTETYTYNTAGNILSRTLAGDTVTYSYDNTQWNDLLTAYDGQKIAYEGQTYNSSRNSVSGTVISGNPVSYYNGKRWNMEWVNGNRLAEASSGTTNVSYTYDRTGLRSTKTVNGTTYHYAYAGDKLVWQEWDGNEMFFFYDESNAPIGFWYHPASGSNVTGYYMTTQQGDITRIEDVNGNVLATYEYDAWGKLISSSGSLATINPLRYRGYYYDTETELYYLSNRYYDPKVSRFINADSTDAVLSANGLYDQNLFAYCDNNPVMRADNEGGFWHIVAGAAVGAVIGVLAQATTNLLSGEDITTDLWKSAITGAVGGFAASTTMGYLGVVAWNAGAAMVVETIDEAFVQKEPINPGTILTEGVIAGAFGVMGGRGNGSRSLFRFGKRTTTNVVKRAVNVSSHKGIKVGLSEAKKAVTYYARSTSNYYETNYNTRSLGYSFTTDVAANIVSKIANGNKITGGRGGINVHNKVSLL